MLCPILAIIAAGLVLAAIEALSAANRATLPETTELALNYTVSWPEKTFAEANKWVQTDASAMFVANDGTVSLNVFWEEGGRNVGV